MSIEKCGEVYQGIGVDIRDINLCADAAGGDTCDGDSGGPFIPQ